ncbi:MAG: hypothetical protein COB41_08170 [Proteobacteria bacterium]|nr:MAG: hypothetical protein COB41_08170 [Pseudomonadota bacterium]
MTELNNQNTINFSFLSQNGNVGFYNKCEVIQVFGFNNDKRKVFNIFTLVIFEDTKQENTDEILTEKLQSFPTIKGIKWGVKRFVIGLEKAKALFEQFQDEQTFKITDKIEVGTFEFIQPQYVQPSDTFIQPQINNILKNNFHCGSYLIEGFDTSKKDVRFLLDAPIILDKFSEQLSEIIPIHIGTVSDRLGSVIFQFPINILKIETLTVGQDQGLQFEICYHPKLQDKPNLQAIIQNSFDDTLLAHAVQDITQGSTVPINTSDLVKLKIINKNNNVVLFKQSLVTVKNISVCTNIMSPQDRFFMLGNTKQRVSVSQQNIGTNIGEQKQIYDDWVRTRIYQYELATLEESLSFIQYKGLPYEREKALNDIRTLINKHNQNGVYLWDPYLNAEDIKNTLYFSNNTQPLKAITNIESSDISSAVNEFDSDEKDYLFLNLEVRRKFKNHGSPFHDRFLIFPLERPKVWSLGISVNSLGKSHHILQEVKHAQHILNAFNTMWDDLNHEECLVWKSM